jgi:penicillin-binding protein 2
MGIVVVSLFATLFARLWYLQVMTSADARVAADQNRIRTVSQQAPRGRILDRNGKVIVGNRVSIQVTIDRSEFDRLGDEQQGSVLTRLADALSRQGIPTTPQQVRERIASDRYSPFAPVPVAWDVREELKIWIDENLDRLPSVAAQRVAVRDYPYGTLAAHVVGYTGRLTGEEYQERKDGPKPYALSDDIGRSGVEARYEAELRGTPGTTVLEVDASNRPVRTLPGTTPPIPGDDVVLNIDIDVQAVAEQALRAGLDSAADRPPVTEGAPQVGRVGSAVAIDPSTGEVLALASAPTFTPADLVDGISGQEWSYLNSKESFYPLNNWALQGQYAPGSTFKPFTAAAALGSGLATPATTINDTGEYIVPNCKGDSCRFRNDRSRAYGPVDLRRSLTVSSDVYYYGLGANFWIRRGDIGGPEAFRAALEPWGFSSRTGIDLPGELPGRIPSPDWLRAYCEKVQCLEGADSWRTGNSVNMAIGQGDVLVTPLQLAVAYAALADGGQVRQPRVAREVRDQSTGEVKETFSSPVVRTVPLRPEWSDAIVGGLVGVTVDPNGTASAAFAGFPNSAFPVAAKTGTAQVSGKAPTAVFGAFAPAGDPRFAIAVLLEESGYGGSAAAPVARRMLDVLSGTIPLEPAPLGGQIDDGEPLTGTGSGVRD